MAESVINLPTSQKRGSGNIAEGITWHRRGNVVMLLISATITDTVNRTLLGTMPPDLYPPIAMFSSGFASGVVSYGLVDTDGKIYGYRSTAGNLLVSVVWSVI